MLPLKSRYQKIAIYIDCFIGLTIGMCAFLYLYGATVLNPTNDNWILTGYAEWDIQQRYAGWINFRNSSWQFPLASAAKLGYPAEKGLNIAFTDSMPLISIFFKSISKLLPSTFQFEGIYSMCIFMLQGISAMLLLRRFSLNRIYSVLGTILFVFSPILLERNFRHTGLASHYLILFSMLLYFCYRKSDHYPWQMLVLSVFSVGITPYFLPMVMIFVLLLSIENAIYTQKYIKSLAFFLGNIITALITAVAIGAVGGGYASTRDGYGFYSMNLNAPINPISCGFSNWSKTLLPRPQIRGQYDGFNYLGLGVLFLLITVLLPTFALFVRRKTKIKRFIVKNIWLLLASIFLTIFATSNIICFDAKELLHIPLPLWLLDLCAIFRASSRLFYPVYYLLILTGIIGLHYWIKQLMSIINIKVVTRYATSGILSLFVFIQLWDMSDLMKTMRETLIIKQDLNLEMPVELSRLDNYDILFVTHSWETRYEEIIAGKNNLYSNALDANTLSTNHQSTSEYTIQICAELDAGVLRNNIAYSTQSEEEFSFWQQKYSDKATFCTWDLRKPYVHISEPASMLYFMLPLQ